jgi:hypothetical protein
MYSRFGIVLNYGNFISLAFHPGKKLETVPVLCYLCLGSPPTPSQIAGCFHQYSYTVLLTSRGAGLLAFFPSQLQQSTLIS